MVAPHAGRRLTAPCGVGKYALLEALTNGNTTIGTYLIRKGADANVHDDLGTTGLMIAVALQFAEQMELLIQCGANVNAANGNGDTALHIAARSGNGHATEMLVKNGAEVDGQNKRTRSRRAAGYDAARPRAASISCAPGGRLTRPARRRGNGQWARQRSMRPRQMARAGCARSCCEYVRARRSADWPTAPTD